MKIILASRSQVRKNILEKNGVSCEVVHSNVDEDQATESLIVVEGYMDVVQLHEHGIKNVLATSGTSLTKDQIILIKRLKKWK